MSTLPEQFSAVRKSQVDAQINFIEQFAAKAVHNAEQVLALNVSTTRAAMETSSAAVRQLLAVRQPADLLALTTQSQASFARMLSYGRELLSIAGSSQALLKHAAPVIAPVLPDEPQPEAPKLAPKVAPQAHAAPVEPSAPAVKSTPAAPPAVKAKPSAKAVSKVAAKALAPTTSPAPVSAPVPASVKPVVVTTLKAVEASPPPRARASGKPALEPRQLDMLAPKAKAKKKK